MSIGLLGGLALFLFGMDQMTVALKEAAGSRMKTLLARMTKNRFRAILAGAFTTAVIQSSSVTTVLTVGFVQSGLMSLQQAIGIVMGASIGTTVTAQIIAFKVTNLALAAIAVGFVMQSMAKRELLRRYGTMLLGLGLVFLGMNLMGEAMAPLRDWPPFIDVHAGLRQPHSRAGGRRPVHCAGAELLGDHRHHHRPGVAGPDPARDRSRPGARREPRHHHHCHAGRDR
jgi:phosphate:Na+ symporter